MCLFILLFIRLYLVFPFSGINGSFASVRLFITYLVLFIDFPFIYSVLYGFPISGINGGFGPLSVTLSLLFFLCFILFSYYFFFFSALSNL